LLFFHI